MLDIVIGIDFVRVRASEIKESSFIEALCRFFSFFRDMEILKRVVNLFLDVREMTGTNWHSSLRMFFNRLIC